MSRGNTLLAEAIRMNFLFLYGCRPSAGVKANTTMVKDILKALMQSADRINYMVLLPQALDQLKGTDASFEAASSSSLQTLKLYYVSNVVTKSLGLVLYHDNGYSYLSKKWDVVIPSIKMLEIALKLDRVHTFGGISIS